MLLVSKDLLTSYVHHSINACVPGNEGNPITYVLFSKWVWFNIWHDHNKCMKYPDLLVRQNKVSAFVKSRGIWSFLQTEEPSRTRSIYHLLSFPWSEKSSTTHVLLVKLVSIRNTYSPCMKMPTFCSFRNLSGVVRIVFAGWKPWCHLPRHVGTRPNYFRRDILDDLYHLVLLNIKFARRKISVHTFPLC